VFSWPTLPTLGGCMCWRVCARVSADNIYPATIQYHNILILSRAALAGKCAGKGKSFLAEKETYTSSRDSVPLVRAVNLGGDWRLAVLRARALTRAIFSVPCASLARRPAPSARDHSAPSAVLQTERDASLFQSGLV
jgi:hypothetical protein